MDFLGIDKALAGLKRGAERFGGKIASRIVKRSELKNGFAPKEPEPYGLGMGGADTEQMSQVPTQAENVKIGIEPAKLRQQNKLDFLKKELPLSQDKAEREAIEYEIAGLEKELSAMPTGDKDARHEKETSVSNDGAPAAAAAQSGGNVDSSALGFQSAEKTTTADREDYENALSPEAARQILKDLQIGMPDEGGYIKADLLSDAEYAQYKEAMLTLGMKPKIKTNSDQNKNEVKVEDGQFMENVDPKCKLCEGTGVADSGSACQACALKQSMKNAGHLSPESWEAASLEERVQWLEKAGMDINLAPQHFTDLSQDVRVAIQDTHDMPSTVNNASGKKYVDWCDCRWPTGDAPRHIEGCQVRGAGDKTPVDTSIPLPKENASGLQKHFVFRDANGEEETVEAADENAAWDKLAHDFATPLADLKAMGLKLVRTNEMENTSDTDTCSICQHPKLNHSVTEPFCKANPNGKTCSCAGFVYSSADYTKRNDNPAGDLEEIARHAEGIEHEVEELAKEGLENGVGEEQAKEIWFSANMNRLEGLLEDLGLDRNLAAQGWDDLSSSARDKIRPHLKGEWSAGNSVSNCAGKCGCATEDHFADAEGNFKCPCNCEQCAALKKTNVLENKSMKNTNTTTCPECSKNGLIKHGEVWACPSCMGEFREGELLTNKGYEETRNSGVSRGSDKYGSKK